MTPLIQSLKSSPRRLLISLLGGLTLVVLMVALPRVTHLLSWGTAGISCALLAWRLMYPVKAAAVSLRGLTISLILSLLIGTAVDAWFL